MKSIFAVMMVGVLVICSAAAVQAMGKSVHKHDEKDHVVHRGSAHGHANIMPTDPQIFLKGSVQLVQRDGGVQVDVEVFNVPGPGEHGFHIHEKGSCEDQGKAAGGHYNPLGAPHGFLPKDGHHAAHMGDMGSIHVDENGHGVLSVFLPGVSLSGQEHSVAGRSVILHEKADDFSQPTGNAGGRIGCGIISLAQ